MIKSNEQFTQATHKNIDCANDFVQTSIESIEKLAALQLNASRKLLAETTDAIKDIAGSNNPKDLFEKVNQLATSSVESNMSNCRNVYDIMSEVQAKVSKYFESQIQCTQSSIVSAVDDLTKFNSAAKSSAASESIKTWLDSTNQAMSAMTKVAGQITEYANNNINAAAKATEAAVKKSVKK